eukprot:4446-Heterococcus_DN1.PRE.2
MEYCFLGPCPLGSDRSSAGRPLCSAHAANTSCVLSAESFSTRSTRASLNKWLILWMLLST